MTRSQLGTLGIAATILIGATAMVVSRPALAGNVVKPKRTMVHNVGWFQSFEEAKVLSKTQKRPILLLSMFGKLDEEMPCANARTLRATLFKDPEFRDFALKEAVLAWEMVREVPKVEIDLGDGKKIKRTLRGNAVMYLCNSDGKVLDAFPGVYTKEAFFPMVRESIKANFGKDGADVVAWHKSGAEKLVRRTIPMTLGKSASESTTLLALGARPNSGSNGGFVKADTPERQAFLRAASATRDLSLTPMSADEVAMATLGKPLAELSPEEAGRAILKADSDRNTGDVRRIIHLWLASEQKLPTPLEARDTVLETILKIPYKDPYFGLRDIVMPGTPN